MSSTSGRHMSSAFTEALERMRNLSPAKRAPPSRDTGSDYSEGTTATTASGPGPASSSGKGSFNTEDTTLLQSAMRMRTPTVSSREPGGVCLKAPSSSSSKRGSAKRPPLRIANENYTFQLGDEIGRGAHGTVYQAFNVLNGDFVAAKRFSKDDDDVDNDFLNSIEAEIALIQKLNHPNVVKYLDTIRTSTHLYIILEYMEHGSLAQVLQRFGAVSEALAAMYIHQVLLGLQYLHEQGVLHRDIKGANVLTSKDGTVKLSDFGVAIQISEGEERDSAGEVIRHVVGSPYWMAPEIIDLASPSPASDIWSVGCLVIELLTCKPPYFHLQPMAAMYHVVQDDCPPLPDMLSPLLEEFLMGCFEKDPTRRETATQLLQSPWLHLAVNQPGTFFSPNGSSVKASTKQVVVPRNQRQLSTTLSSSTSLTGSSQLLESLMPVEVKEVMSLNDEDKGKDKDKQSVASVPTQAMSISPLRLLRAEKESEALRFNSTSFSHLANSSILAPSRRRSVSSSGILLPAPILMKLDLIDVLEGEDRMRRAKGDHGSSSSGAALSPGKISTKSSHSSLEYIDASLILPDGRGRGDSTEIAGRINEAENSTRGKVSSPTARVSTPVSFEDEWQGARAMSTQDRIAAITRSSSYEQAVWMDSSVGRGTPTRLPDRSTPTFDGRSSVRKSLLKDIAAIRTAVSEEDIATLCEGIISSLSTFPAAATEFIGSHGIVVLLDVFDAVEAKFGPRQLHHILRLITVMISDDGKAQEQLALGGFFPSLVRIIGSASDAKANQPSELNPFFVESAILFFELSLTSPTAFRLLIGAGGLQALVLLLSSAVEVLQTSSLQAKIPTHAFGRMAEEDENEWEIPTLSSPYTAKMPGKDRAVRGREFRLQSSKGVHSEMGVDSDTIEKAKRIVYVVIDALLMAFQLSGNDKSYCHVLIRLGLLPPLARAFSILLADENKSFTDGSASSVLDEDTSLASTINTQMTHVSKMEFAFSPTTSQPSEESNELKCATRIAILLRVFTYGDTNILDALTRIENGVLSAIILTLQTPELRASVFVKNPDRRRRAKTQTLELSGEYIHMIEKLLKILKNMSIDTSTLNNLDKAGTVLTLIPLLKDGRYASRFEQQIIPTLFNLCRMSKRRQEQAALSGIIPYLIRIINEGPSLLKQFALPLMCDMAHSTHLTRIELWKYDGVAFYSSLLQNEHWKTYSLNSLAVWLANDVANVEALLLTAPHINRLIDLFRLAAMPSLPSLNNTLLKMMSKSTNLCFALGSSGLFVSSLITRLSQPVETLLLLSSLRMLRLLHMHHAHPRQLVLDLNVYAVLSKLAETSSAANQVLVFEKCRLILLDLQASTFS